MNTHIEAFWMGWMRTVDWLGMGSGTDTGMGTGMKRGFNGLQWECVIAIAWALRQYNEWIVSDSLFGLRESCRF